MKKPALVLLLFAICILYVDIKLYQTEVLANKPVAKDMEHITQRINNTCTADEKELALLVEAYVPDKVWSHFYNLGGQITIVKSGCLNKYLLEKYGGTLSEDTIATTYKDKNLLGIVQGFEIIICDDSYIHILHEFGHVLDAWGKYTENAGFATYTDSIAGNGLLNEYEESTTAEIFASVMGYAWMSTRR